MKKTLSQAIAAATLLGAAASAHAIHVDPNGHGQALLYPLYTVEQGNYSVMSITNTTDKFKAVKVRFLEGANSQEVLDFNLYLSPYDVWTGAVVPDGDGARLVSTDQSCISANPDGFPADGMKFRLADIAHEGDLANQLARTRVGHMEVIEMAEVDKDHELSILVNNLHGYGPVSVYEAMKSVNGNAPNCAAVTYAWSNVGVWGGDGPHTDPETYMSEPTGGLYGTGYIINVDKAWSSSYDATALANMSSDEILHVRPGNERPNLGDAFAEAVFANGTWGATNNGWDAASAVLMKESIQNDYVVGAGLNAQTEMVFTFPTKRPYVNFSIFGVPMKVSPFSSTWDGKEACEPVKVTYWDREENEEYLDDDQISPTPKNPGFKLCHETNLVKISNSNLFGGDLLAHDLNFVYSEGWMNMDLTGPGRTVRLKKNATAANPKGLPVIGFSTVVVENGVTSSGVLNTYAQSYEHKAEVTNGAGYFPGIM